jgi:protein tyrosine phosphatase (PTP) superfamily phosphohydrolase (DUF442 family)/cytochrome c556
MATTANHFVGSINQRTTGEPRVRRPVEFMGMEKMRRHRLGGCVWLIAAALGCAGCGRAPQAADAKQAKQPPRAAATISPTKEPSEPGILNVVRITPSLYSGSEPKGEEGFASLAKMGIKTVVSVDGARPNLDLAHQHGMKYVHVPIGYDAITPQAGKTLARAAREAEGPIYVHCHHGEHRGPAAAAVMCMAAEGVSGEQAKQILEVAGTGKQYPGLWRDVAAYMPPAADVELPELVEMAQVETYPAAMAKIDRNFDNLKLCQQARWSVPAEHPDLVAAQEAVILREGLHEAKRNLTADRNAEFRQWLAGAEGLAAELEQTIRQREPDAADATFTLLEASCKKCHAKYRN